MILKLNLCRFTFREKIQPQAIIENVRATARGDSDQLDFFSDFNGLNLKT